METKTVLESVVMTTIGNKSVETLCHIRVIKANFLSSSLQYYPLPFVKLDFLSLEFASFLYNIEKGSQPKRVSTTFVTHCLESIYVNCGDFCSISKL